MAALRAGLESNLRDLSARIERGAFRASPVGGRIPKADGRQRPLGVPRWKTKLSSARVVEVLNAIYEQDFLGFSTGSGRSAARTTRWMRSRSASKREGELGARCGHPGFFDTLNHEWLIRFLEHRVADRRVRRLIQRWLRAGVLEDGKRRRSEVGTVQGGSISPLLANIYLHYVFDLWVQRWRQTQARGDVVVGRFADDFVVGFEHREEAERFLAELRERFARFGLALHPDKTRLIEFGRHADRNRRDRGDGKPETFNFLGFTHSCSKTRKGRFTVLRQTRRHRWQAKLHEVKTELRRRLHDSIPEQARIAIGACGACAYYGVPRNGPSLQAFRGALGWLWWRADAPQSDRLCPWTRMQRLVMRWLPVPHICHPYPNQRLAFITQGKSRMR